MRRWISVSILGELAIVSICLISPARAASIDAASRLRFSLIHEAVPRYYEMFGLLGASEPSLAGSPLLPAIEPPVTFSMESGSRDFFLNGFSDSGPPRPSDARGARYSLTENWTAQLSYHHSFLAQTLSNAELRNKKMTEFSTERERDVLGLQMDWRLAGSTLDVGYRFQSMRGEPGSGLGGIGDRFLHAFTLGITREWGGADSSEP